jgi:hypothetical protein
MFVKVVNLLNLLNLFYLIKKIMIKIIIFIYDIFIFMNMGK